MGSISSLDAQSCRKAALKSAIEGAALSAIIAGFLAFFLDGKSAKLAMLGLAAAWAVSSAGVTMLIFADPGTFSTFLRAYGAGVAMRAGVLIVLMAAVYGKAWAVQAPLLGAYVLGVLTLLLIEIRHLKRKAS